MIEGFNFAQKDMGSASDPYLVIQCGKKIYNERDNYQLDQVNPTFFKSYEFDAEFPGAAPLSIKAYDYDDLFGDDLIGETIIDLDDRFFSPEWQSIRYKPVEFRQLMHSSTTASQGVVKMWVEINTVTSSNNKADQVVDTVWDIKPRPQKAYEMRVVVWDTKELACMDVEGTSDAFVKAYLDPKSTKETDCHYRCSTGNASFNYRMLYQNDLIGEVQLDLKSLFEDVIETGRTFQITKKYYNQYLRDVMPNALEFEDEDSFWLPLKGRDDSSGEVKVQGYVRLSVTVMPKADADANKVGDARSEPNHSPFLPQPTGRLEFQPLNPLKMLTDLVGPELKRKLIMYTALIACAALCVMCLPMIFSNLVSQAILKIF